MSALEIHAAESATIAISQLTLDPELQCRAAGIDKRTVTEYAAALKAGAQFPPIVVFRCKSTFVVSDGWHRVQAHIAAGLNEILADVREGSKKDALLHAAGANVTHGRARTPADKRRAVSLLLADQTWAKRSDNWIAQHAAVSHTFVGKLRAATCNVSSEVRESADGRTLDTSKIGGAAETDDAIVSKLSKQFDRTISAWPDSRHDALRKYLSSVLEALSP